MTEYDAHDMYQKQIEKDKISAIEGNKGLLTVYFKDGTIEHWKKSKWRNKLKKIRSRNEN